MVKKNKDKGQLEASDRGNYTENPSEHQYISAFSIKDGEIIATTETEAFAIDFPQESRASLHTKKEYK